MTAKYDLNINRGANYNLFLQYLGTADNAINLSGYSASMQIKRYKDQDYPLVILNTRGITYGYTGGFTTGYSDIGGISLNTNYNGSTGFTGGILIRMGASTTSSFPTGRLLYDVEITLGTTYTNRLLEGRIDISGDVSNEG